MNRSSLRQWLPCAGACALVLLVAPRARAHHPGEFPVTLTNTNVGGLAAGGAAVLGGAPEQGRLSMGASSTYLRLRGHPQFGPVVGGDGGLLVTGAHVLYAPGARWLLTGFLPWVHGLPDEGAVDGGLGDPLLAARFEQPLAGGRGVGGSLALSLPLGDARRGRGAGAAQSRIGALAAQRVGAGRLVLDGGLSWGWGRVMEGGGAALDYAAAVQYPAAYGLGLALETRAQTALTDTAQSPLAFAVEPRRRGDTLVVLSPMLTWMAGAAGAGTWDLTVGPRLPVGARQFEWALVLAGGYRFGS